MSSNSSSWITLLQNKSFVSMIIFFVMILKNIYKLSFFKQNGTDFLTHIYCAEACYKLCKTFWALIFFEHTLGKHVAKRSIINTALLLYCLRCYGINREGYILLQKSWVLRSSWYYFMLKLYILPTFQRNLLVLL
jgi:hypothetical protein